MIYRDFGHSRSRYAPDSPKHLGNHASFRCDRERYAMNWIIHQSTQVRVWEGPHHRNTPVAPPRILEIGTYWGLSLVEFSRMVPGAELYSLNILPEQVEGSTIEIIPKEEIGWYAKSKNVSFRQFFGDSRTFDYSSLSTTFDIVFIDGRHEKGYVDVDTQRTLPLLNPGGVLVWHDYHRDPSVPVNVADAINDMDERLFGRGLTNIEQTSLVYWVKSST